ncbi:MAG: polyhydroxyalkanoic acid system family protein [Pirellulales bacterium]
MPKFSVTVPHQLSREDANKLVDRFVEEVLLVKFKDSIGDVEHQRNGDALEFKLKTFGIQITGRALATDKEFVVDGDLPFTAMMFKGKIESSIRQQLERLATFGVGPKK